MRKIIISGGFDPLHKGHVRLIKEAKKLGDYLIVILNNDNWLENKKMFHFLEEEERKEIIIELRSVDEVILSKHVVDDNDISVIRALSSLREKHHDDELVFANGGDRKANNIPEYKYCEDNNIELFFNIGGGKVNSSSDIAKRDKR